MDRRGLLKRATVALGGASIIGAWAYNPGGGGSGDTPTADGDPKYVEGTRSNPTDRNGNSPRGNETGGGETTTPTGNKSNTDPGDVMTNEPVFSRWVPAFDAFHPDNGGFTLVFTSLTDIRDVGGLSNWTQQAVRGTARQFNQQTTVPVSQLRWTLSYDDHYVIAGNIPKAGVVQEYGKSNAVERLSEEGDFAVFQNTAGDNALGVADGRVVGAVNEGRSWDFTPEQRVRSLIQTATGQTPTAAEKIDAYTAAIEGHNDPHVLSTQVTTPQQNTDSSTGQFKGMFSWSGGWRFTPRTARLYLRTVFRDSPKMDAIRRWADTDALSHYESSVRATDNIGIVEGVTDPGKVDFLRPGPPGSE